MEQQPDLPKNGTKSKFTLPVIVAFSALCCACVCALSLLYYYGDAIEEWVWGVNPAENAQPATAVPDENQQATDSSLPEWTIIYYAAADDEALEVFMWFDVNEMELVGSSPQVNIVVQMDRYQGGFDYDGNWTDTRRFLVTQDGDLEAIASPVLENLGEADMGDPQTLADFTTWAIQNYPAQKYALVLSDHGGGWTGGYLDAYSGSDMSLPEIASALEAIRQNTGVDKFELLVFDACLMAQIEIFGSLYPYANYIVASEEIIPGMGLSYAAWLGQMAANPAMDGAEASRALVSTYIVDDVMLQGSQNANQIAYLESTATLSAIDSARIPDVIGAMNNFITLMAGMDQTMVAEARSYTRHYYPVFGGEFTPYIDLGNFAAVLSSLSGSAEVEQAALQLQNSISEAVIAEKHGAGMSGSNGIAFHFPESDIYYWTELSGDISPTYVDASSRFLEQSHWDEFLAFHYTGVAFAPQEGIAFAPSRAAEIVAPGASELTISPLQVSDTEITGDEVVTVSTTVEGNVAYIYTALYFYDPQTESYWVGDISYYIAENIITVDGVNSPDYGPSPVQVQYEWTPSLYIFTDGQHEAFALFEPLEYLSAEGNTVYGVYGQYTIATSSTPVDTQLSFDAYGNFLSAYAFPDPDGDGASNPVQIVPQPGDHFTEYDQFITYDAEDNPTYEYFLSQDIFTWGEQGFSFHSSPPVDGEYALVVTAYDFDGNFVWNYEFITYRR